MSKKDKTNLRSKSLEELRKMVSEKKAEADNVKVKVLSGQEKNLKAFRNLRVEIARILTLIKQKSIMESLDAKKEASK